MANSKLQELLKQAVESEFKEKEEIGELTEAEKKLWTIFEERPVTLNEFIQGDKYLAMGSSFELSEIQYDLVRHMEQIYFKDTYELMESAWGEYWKPGRQVNNIVAAWGKGSSAPYEHIYDAETGSWTRLDEINDTSVCSVGSDNISLSSRISMDPFEEGYGRMVRVSTARGRQMDVWEGHKFYTSNRVRRRGKKSITDPSWVPVSDLSIGSEIAVVTSLPEPTHTETIPDEHVELIAFLLANGSLSGGHKGNITWGVDAVKSIERTVELFNCFPDTEAVVRVDTSSGSTRVRVIPKTVGSTAHSKAVWDFCIRYGLAGKTSYTKTIPDIIYRLDNRQIRLFVSRLVDSDGWVSSSNTSEVGYATVSDEFAEGVCRLWLRLGVLPEKKYRNVTYQGGSSKAWQVRVRSNKEVQSLLSQLDLLDKKDSAENVLEFVEGKKSNLLSDGDIFWDKIVSIEDIGEGVYWSMTVADTANYVAAGGILNHNSGKNQTIVIAFARITYLLMCLKSPQEYFGLAPNSFIHMMNVALSAPQAHRAFFKPMRELFISAPWFENKFAEDTPPGPQATFIRLKKRIELISGHSQADSQEGNNLICAVADEIAGFPTVPTSGSEKAPMRTADGILKMLKTSALTRFPVTYKLAQISFSRYIGDPIMSALDEAEKDMEEMGENSTYYASGPHRTWDVHPKYRKGFEFVKIPQTDEPVPNVPDILADYRKRPAFSRGYYECRPEASDNAHFKDKEKVKSSFSRKVSVPPIKINYYFGVDSDEKYPSWQVDFEFGPQMIPVPGAVYAIHADMALKEDRAGVAMCHVSHFKEIETSTSDGSERFEYRPVVKMDFATAFEYDASATDPDGNSVPREIQVRWFRKLVLALSDMGFVFGSVSQDGWQSTDSLQILQAWGYEAHKVSTDVVTTPCWNTLRDLMYDGRFDGYEHNLLVNELLALEKTSRGKIDHPANNSKDIADAVAASATMAVECGGEEEIGENTYDSVQFSPSSIFDSRNSTLYDSDFEGFGGGLGEGFGRVFDGTGNGLW